MNHARLMPLLAVFLLLSPSITRATHALPVGDSSYYPGGNDFILLKQPRIAILTGPDISTSGVGSLWHLLDFRLRFRVSLLNGLDVRAGNIEKYNVILLPPGSYQVFGKAGAARLKDWMMRGGTVIGMGSAAGFLADTSLGMTDVRLRQNMLKELDLYSRSVDFEAKARTPVVDSVMIWEGRRPAGDTARVEKTPPPNERELLLADERMRLFMPRGTIMRVDLDAEHWLTFGAGDRVPAILFTQNAFLSKEPVQTPARLADYEHLRLSGLLWPEARERWARTAYATREARGKGQLILFTGEPEFRSCFYGTERLLLNALFLGPGFGTEHPVEW